jgi:hypothetical protein
MKVTKQIDGFSASWTRADKAADLPNRLRVALGASGTKLQPTVSNLVAEWVKGVELQAASKRLA